MTFKATIKYLQKTVKALKDDKIIPEPLSTYMAEHISKTIKYYEILEGLKNTSKDFDKRFIGSGL